jgi:hypothetical protein
LNLVSSFVAQLNVAWCGGAFICNRKYFCNSMLLTYYLTDNNYDNNGIYQLNCLDCPKKYIGQTGRTFKTRYKEHIHAVRNNRSDMGYSRHILETGHTYGNIENTMEIKKAWKRKFLDSPNKYHIFLASKQQTHMHEFDTDQGDPIFET